MPPTVSARDRVLRLAKASGVIRSRDLQSINVPREYLRRLIDAGDLERTGRGLYQLAGARPTARQSLIEVCKRAPNGVICLLSALQFHRLTTELPRQVWLAIESKAWAPKLEYPPLRVLRYSPASLRYGVEEHRIGGALVRVFNPAKTAADCFKFRHRIGLETAIEALRDCLRRRAATPDEIGRAAAVCRVARVMQPYLEALA